MRKTIKNILAALESAGNLRHIPDDADNRIVDLSSNDYLGLAGRSDLREEFMKATDACVFEMSSSASRLLAAHQEAYSSLEKTLEEAYGNGCRALVLNSGYHANTGLVGSLGGLPGVYVLADKLVHASIIDGIKLSGAPFGRFRHNDYDHLRKLIAKAVEKYKIILLIVESVYSMDGDRADMTELGKIKAEFPEVTLYVDEAHAVGVEGERGLGLSRGIADIIVGTFGKALASVGAYALVEPEMRDFLINKARSLIFSTALPPINVRWSEFLFLKSLDMDNEREKLRANGRKLGKILSKYGTSPEPSHIKPLVTGDPRKAVEMSDKLRSEGFVVLPIRTPTVPPGTDRLRFSLSAETDMKEIDRLAAVLDKIITE